jgi:hypothetical protein
MGVKNGLIGGQVAAAVFLFSQLVGNLSAMDSFLQSV